MGLYVRAEDESFIAGTINIKNDSIEPKQVTWNRDQFIFTDVVRNNEEFLFNSATRRWRSSHCRKLSEKSSNKLLRYK